MTIYTKPQLEVLADKYADKYGIDPDVFHSLITQESGWNPKALSKEGASGLAQMMPANWKAYNITDPHDPDQSLNAGAKMLAGNLAKYKGDYTKAIAAYNAGGGNVDKYGGVPPFVETQNYVHNIRAMTDHRKLSKEMPSSQENELSSIVNQPIEEGGSKEAQSPKIVNNQELLDGLNIGPEKESGQKQIRGEPLNPLSAHTASSKDGPIPWLKLDQQANTHEAQVSPESYMPFSDFVQASYPGGIKAFEQKPSAYRYEKMRKYTDEYLHKSDYYKNLPQEQQDKINRQNYELTKDQNPINNFLAGTGNFLNSLVSSATGGLIGQPENPESNASQVGSYLGPLAGNLAAVVGANPLGVASKLSPMITSGLYGAARGGSESAQQNESPTQIATHALTEGGANALTGGLLNPESNLIQRGAVNAGIGGVVGGINEAVNQSEQGQPLDPSKIIQQAAISAGQQALLGEGLHQLSNHLLGIEPSKKAQESIQEVQNNPETEARVEGSSPPFNQSHPDYQNKVQEFASNESSVKIAQKIYNSHLTDMAKLAKENPEQILDQTLPEHIQFYKDVLDEAKENELVNPKTSTSTSVRKTVSGKLFETEKTSTKTGTHTQSYSETKQLDAPYAEAVDNGIHPPENLVGLAETKQSSPQLVTEMSQHVEHPSTSEPIPNPDVRLQQLGPYTTLNNLLEDPAIYNHFNQLPLQTQINIMEAEKGALNNHKLDILAYQPKTGQMSSGQEGIFTIPEADKRITPLGFEYNKSGIKLHAYNNNLMPRQYFFKSSDEGIGIAGLNHTNEPGYVGRNYNAYHSQQMYEPSHTIMRVGLNNLTDTELQHLQEPTNTLNHNTVRAKINELFTNDPTKGNFLYKTLSDKEELYNHIQELLGPKGLEALTNSDYTPEMEQTLRNILKKDPDLQRLVKILGC